MRWIDFTGLLISVLVLSGCFDTSGSTTTVKPNAMGRLNEIVVVADEDLWEGSLQDTFLFYFESAYPIMPAPEPLFDVRHFTYDDLVAEPLRKELRTYVFLADISDANSRTTNIIRGDIGDDRFLKAQKGEITTAAGKDKWARGQLIVFLMGNGEEQLAESIRKNFPSIARKVNDHDQGILEARVFAARDNPGLSRKIAQEYGIRLNIPARFQIAMDNPDENIIWLRKDDKESILNLVIRKFNYTNSNQLTPEYLKKIRDDYGVDYVSTNQPGSFMLINDRDLPMYDYSYEINGLYTKEIRGIWEISNDFMGGPFASYLILDKDRNQLIFIDTFVYAPGKNKRDMMQQLEFIVKSANPA